MSMTKELSCDCRLVSVTENIRPQRTSSHMNRIISDWMRCPTVYWTGMKLCDLDRGGSKNNFLSCYGHEIKTYLD